MWHKSTFVVSQRHDSRHKIALWQETPFDMLTKALSISSLPRSRLSKCCPWFYRLGNFPTLHWGRRRRSSALVKCKFLLLPDTSQGGCHTFILELMFAAVAAAICATGRWEMGNESLQLGTGNCQLGISSYSCTHVPTLYPPDIVSPRYYSTAVQCPVSRGQPFVGSSMQIRQLLHAWAVATPPEPEPEYIFHKDALPCPCAGCKLQDAYCKLLVAGCFSFCLFTYSLKILQISHDRFFTGPAFMPSLFEQAPASFWFFG